MTKVPASQRLLAEIEAFLVETKMSAGSFGLRAVNNGKLVPRLRQGQRVSMETGEDVRGFMAEARRLRAAGERLPGQKNHKSSVR